ncbi:MAG: M48 family metallopeptidase [bacterium]
MPHLLATGTLHRGVAFLGLAVATAAMVGCATVTEQQESQMGASYSADLAKQLPLIKDPEVQRYINTLGDSLAGLTLRSQLTWHFEIVDDMDVNAFAVPGGYIYVNRGLIERAQTLDQVAGVVGHEIGHVVRRHSVKQMEKQQNASLGVALGCALTAFCQSGASQQLIGLAANGVFAKFSRNDEAEADAEGVKLMLAAHIDPRGVPEMFRILLDERKSKPAGLDAMFLSHPLEEDRITATQALIATYPASTLTGLTKDSPNFQAFKKRLQSLPAAPPKKKATK